MTRSGDFLDFGQLFWQQLICPNLPAFLGNFRKGVKIYHFYSEITFRQLLQTFGDFYLVTLEGRSPGLVVMGEDSCSKGPVYWMDIWTFLHIDLLKKMYYLFEKTENKRKRGWSWPIKKNIYSMRCFSM